MTFAALENRVNSTALSKLANAVAMLEGAAVAGIFDNGYRPSNDGIGMAGSQPMFTLSTASVPASPVGKTLVHAAIGYIVVEHQPDGTGLSVLFLERAV